MLPPEKLSTEHWHLLQVALDTTSARIDSALTQELQLSSREFMMLRTLSTQYEGDGGHYRMKDLALAVGLSPSATTRLMTRMESRGLLTRYICATDRRGIYTDVSATGLELLDKAEKIAARIAGELEISINGDAVVLSDPHGPIVSQQTINRN